jgi:hypothetical protein
MSEESRKETIGFSWEDLGDIAEGRPNLGNLVPVSVYRLLQFTLRDAITEAYDDETARKLLVAAGRRAGREYCRNVLDTALGMSRFLADLQKKLREWSIGILRIEKSDLERREFILSVAEDLDCSGLAVSDNTVCDFDEGFIAGIFLEYTGQEFRAREIDCWASGERVCRFEVAPGD